MMTNKRWLTLRADRVLEESGWLSDCDVTIDIVDGRIVGKTSQSIEPSGAVVDLSGLSLVPGFIDVHSMEQGPHSVAGKDAANLLAQGVTTIVTGNCGVGYPRPASGALPVNVLPLVGHNAVIVENDLAPSQPAVSIAMDELIQRGASLGLMYEPGRSSVSRELRSIARSVKRQSGVLAIHMRDEGDGFVESIDEVIGLAELCQVVVMHLKACGQRNWSKLPSQRRRLEERRIPFTYYPYSDTNTRLDACYPPDPSELESSGLQTLARDGWSGVVISRNCDPSLVGLSIHEVAIDRGTTEAEAFESLLAEWPDCRVRFVEVCETSELRVTSQSAFAMPASDAYVFSTGDSNAEHPRNYGAIAKAIRWGREGGYQDRVLAGLTRLPAQVYGFRDRGAIRHGAVADLVAMATEDVADHASFESPTELATGVQFVWVRGQLAFSDGVVVHAGLGVEL